MNTLPSELEATSMALLSLGTLLADGYDHGEHLWVREVPILNAAIQAQNFDAQGWAAGTIDLLFERCIPLQTCFYPRTA